MDSPVVSLDMRRISELVARAEARQNPKDPLLVIKTMAQNLQA
jgi:hypothetical protein